MVQRRLSGESENKLSKETGISRSSLYKKVKQYLSGGIDALENKRKPGNPLSKYSRKKELSREEALEYEL